MRIGGNQIDTCIAWAQALELEEVVTLLEATLNEEKAAEKLSALAESGINEAATAGADNEDEDAENEDVENDAPVAAGAAKRSTGATPRTRTTKGSGRR